MFEIFLKCQYEGVEERVTLNAKIIALRKMLKALSTETYSEEIESLKYSFFVSGEFGTFEGESGVSAVRFYKARKYIKVEIVVQKDISHSNAERISTFLHETIIQSLHEIIRLSKGKKVEFDNSIIRDIEGLFENV